MQVHARSHGFVVQHNTGKVLKRFKCGATGLSDPDYIDADDVDKFVRLNEPGLEIRQDSLWDICIREHLESSKELRKEVEEKIRQQLAEDV